MTMRRTWLAAVARWPVDLAAPSWLGVSQYRFLDTAAVPFRSITIEADLRCREPDTKKGAQGSSLTAKHQFHVWLQLQHMGTGQMTAPAMLAMTHSKAALLSLYKAVVPGENCHSVASTASADVGVYIAAMTPMSGMVIQSQSLPGSSGSLLKVCAATIYEASLACICCCAGHPQVGLEASQAWMSHPGNQCRS